MLAAGVESMRTYTREEQLKMGIPADIVDHPDFIPVAPVLDDIEYFDAGFFGMTDREAAETDPQHRLFLELVQTALEDAAYDPARYPGLVGVYAGTGPDDYLWRHVRRSPRNAGVASAFSVGGIGNTPDYVSTFASYKLNLRGPSMTVLTACSTSLVAMHLACEALRSGECDLALAGGVCIELPHGKGYIAYEGGVASQDGHCRPFDSRASGTLWGSGGGVVVLKRLDEALADGDHVRAVVLSNALNNDGATKVGFTAPSVQGQTEVVAQALAVAGVDPRTISYVEAHGTATALGDPIEVAALTNAYGAGTDDRGWCGLGSIKSNIGHLSQGAGVAGVIKTVLALEHEMIPPSLNFETPNPAIDFANSPFYVTSTVTAWTRGPQPRRAAVSSFGIGGTNAHLILQEAPLPQAEPAADGPSLIQLSARSAAALASAAERLAAHLEKHPQLRLADVAHTLRVGRTAHAHRATVVATDTADAVAALGNRKRLLRDEVTGQPQVALLFSGQGSQYPGMAAQLYLREPVFRAAVDACAAVLGYDPLGGDAERLNRTEYTQPALFAVEYALAKLWQSWGLRPAAMLGHSIGEYVAATLAGVFTLPDALRLVAARGRLMQSMPPGAMLAVQAGEEHVRGILPTGLSIAAVNGPGACVVAGPNDQVEAFAAALSEQEIGSRRLRTSHAFHSPMMEPILAEFTALVAGVPRSAPSMPFLSNRTGDWITAEQAVDPAYWAQHLRQTVRFGECVARLLAAGDWLLVECGPGAQLAGLARMQLAAGARLPMASLPGPDDQRGDLATMYATAGKLWSAGVALDGFGTGGRRVPLPAYPFERGYHWVDETPDGAVTAPAEPVAERVLAMEQWCSVPVWRQVPPAASAVPRRCLLLAEADVAAELAAGLGPDVTVVNECDDFAALLASYGPVERIVHAWCLSRPGDLERGFYSLLALSQALAGSGADQPIHLDVLTAGTLGVIGGDVTQPVDATVRGVITVLPLEVPVVTARHIDLASAADLATAVAQVCAPPGDETVAVRHGRRYVADFAPVPLPAGERIRAGGVYLITGGLGGIGITVAEDLGLRYQAKLILTARTGLPPRHQWPALAGVPGRIGRAIAAIGRIEAAGGEVLVVAADTTSAEDLRAVRDAAVDRFGQINAIVHAAGVPGGGLIEVKQREAAEAVLAPKVAGTLALAEVFGDLDLDFVALCSSTTGVAGGLGQVDYAAANAFLDAYAGSGAFRCPVTSIDWGAWLEVGMAVETDAAALQRVQRHPDDRPRHGDQRPTTTIDHPMLSYRYTPADGGPIEIGGVIRPAIHWVIGEHRVAGVPLMPGTGHVELARAAIAAAVPPPSPDAVLELRDLTFLQPMMVPDGSEVELRVLVEPADGGVSVQITGPGAVYASGSGGWVTDAHRPPPRDLAALRAKHGPRQESAIDQSPSGELILGPHWGNRRYEHIGDGSGLVRLEVAPEYASDVANWVLHPAMLDDATGFLIGGDTSRLPLNYGRLTVYGPIRPAMWAHVRIRATGDVRAGDIQLLDEDGQVLVDIVDFSMRKVDMNAMMPLLSAAKPAPTDGVGIAPALGVQVLRRLAGSDLGPQVLVSVRPVADMFARARVVTTATVANQDGLATPDVVRDGDFEAPRTELEATIAAIWGQVLGVAAVSRDDDFFDLGGNSLVAVQLVGQIRKAVQVRLPMRSVFESSTVAGMAELIERLRATEPAAADTAATTIPRLARPQ
jgi:acyl transferase domain-containing protein/acyl carrier protein